MKLADCPRRVVHLMEPDEPETPETPGAAEARAAARKKRYDDWRAKPENRVKLNAAKLRYYYKTKLKEAA